MNDGSNAIKNMMVKVRMTKFIKKYYPTGTCLLAFFFLDSRMASSIHLKDIPLK